MTSKQPFLALLQGVLIVAQVACSARKEEDGSYKAGGITEDASATDRAETTVAVTDTASLILPADTAAVKRKNRL